MSVQTNKSIPLSNHVHKTIDILMLFKSINKADIRAIWEDMMFLSKEVLFDLLSNYVFQKPNDCLVLDSCRDNKEYNCKCNKSN